MAQREETDPWRQMVMRFAYLVGVAWFGSLVVDMASESYDPDPTIGAAMLIVCGALFSENVIRGRRNGNGNSERKDP